jgi:CheY-like chemotaxis protein
MPTLESGLLQVGLEVVTVPGGGEAVRRAGEEGVAVVALDVAMPDMSGIESCRLLKAELGERAPKVALVSTFAFSVVEQRAREAGCDLLVLSGEAPAKLLEFFMSEVGVRMDTAVAPPVPPPALSAIERPPRKVAVRVDIPGVVTVVRGDREFTAWSINSSRTGLLFASPESLPENEFLRFRFALPDGRPLELSGVAVRTTELREPREGLPFGVGARYVNLDAGAAALLDELIAYRSLSAASVVQPDFVRTFLANGEEILSKAFATGEFSPEVAFHLETVGEFEKTVFTSDGPAQECVRKLVILRVCCSAFRVFIPSIREQRAILAPVYLPLLDEILSKADAIETDVDLLVKSAVAQGDDTTRQGLNESSNRLYQAKLRVIYAVDEMIPGTGLGGEADVIRKINERVRSLQELSTHTPEVVRYNTRRATAAPTPRSDKEPAGVPVPVAARPETPAAVPVRTPNRLPALLRIAAVLLVGFVAYLFLSRPASVNLAEVKSPIRMERIRAVPGGVEIEIRTEAWVRVPKRTRETFLKALEDAIRRKGIRFANLRNEEGETLAQILSAEVDGGLVYARRIPTKSFVVKEPPAAPK